MSIVERTFTAKDTPLEHLAADLATLVDKVESLIQTTQSSLPNQSTADWDALLQRLKTALREVQSAPLPGGQLAVFRAGDEAVGVAFAAGSWPIGACPRMAMAALGWTFGAGLLLGLLIRRR